MQFVNFKDQYVYDGELPYIHWFPEKISVNIFSYLPLMWIKDTDEPSTIKIVDGMDIWEGLGLALFDPNSIGPVSDQSIAGRIEVINNEEYFNVNKHLTNTLQVQGQAIGNGKYVYVAYLITKSYLDYEFIWDIKIDGNNYQVGAEFYRENESLKINLSNMGVEIPDFVNKAFYEEDMFERDPNYISLNRKWKELLINFMDVIGTKGSYNSLLNSLSWFEYGDLVKLREVWRYNTPDGWKFFDQDIKATLTNEYNIMLTNSVKTTSFYLRNLMNATDYKHTIETNQLGFEDVEKIDCKWCISEMRLKMILLGNFFEQYFMPVHTELIRSVCEEIDRCIDIEVGWCSNNNKYFEDNATINHSLEVVVPEKVNISNVRCFCYPDKGIFEQCKEEIETEDGIREHFYLAMHEYNPEQKNVLKYANENIRMYGGVGVLVPFTIKLPKDSDGNPVQITKLALNTDLYSYLTNTYYNAAFEFKEDLPSEVSFNILFTRVGDFVFNFTAYDEYENEYINSSKVTIEDGIQVDLEFKKMTWKGPTTNPFSIMENNNWEKYMFIRNQKHADYHTYSAYIPTKLKDDPSDDLPRLYPTEIYSYTGSRKKIFEILNTINCFYNVSNRLFPKLSLMTFPFIKPNDQIDDSCYIPIEGYTEEGDKYYGLMGTYDKEYNELIDWPWSKIIPNWEETCKDRRFYWRIGSSCIKFRNSSGKMQDVYSIKERSLLDEDGNILYEDEGGIRWSKISKEGETIYKNVETGEVKTSSEGLKRIENEWLWIQFINVKGPEIFFDPKFKELFNTHYKQDVFIPEFHELKDVKGRVSRDYPIVVKPVIRTSEGDKEVLYSYEVEGDTWDFYSLSSLKKINQDFETYNIREPFIASKYYARINSGMYDVTFRYNWSGETKEVVRKTPFIITK